MNKFKFKKFNMNPKNKNTTDCVIRSLACAMDTTWDDMLQYAFEFTSRTKIMFCETNAIKSLLKEKGWKKQPMPKRDDGTKYSIEEFVETLANKDETYIISIRSHITVIKNLTLLDTWDCSDYKMGNYWIKDNTK